MQKFNERAEKALLNAMKELDVAVAHAPHGNLKAHLMRAKAMCNTVANELQLHQKTVKKAKKGK